MQGQFVVPFARTVDKQLLGSVSAPCGRDLLLQASDFLTREKWSDNIFLMHGQNTGTSR